MESLYPILEFLLYTYNGEPRFGENRVTMTVWECFCALRVVQSQRLDMCWKTPYMEIYAYMFTILKHLAYNRVIHNSVVILLVF